jgi:hypothetical protein
VRTRFPFSRSSPVGRYQRLTRKAEALIAAIYLAGTTGRAALRPVSRHQAAKIAVSARIARAVLGRRRPRYGRRG